MTRISALIIGLGLWVLPAQSQAGFSLSAQTGMTSCIPSGEADCTNTYPGFLLGAAMEVRFWYLGISLDFDHSWAIVGGGGSEDVSSTAMHATPMLKGYYPLDGMDIFLGVGTGYSSISVTDDRTDSEATWQTWWQGMKVSSGVVFDLAKAFGWPDGFAVDAGANFFLNFGGTRCVKYAKAGPCQAIEELRGGQSDVSSQLQLNGALRYTF